MTDKKVAQETVSKALESLQELAKGHKSGATRTTQVETMSGAGGSTQVYHTPSNSDPGGWAGSVGRDVPENGATDSIDANGTDLKGVSSGLMKSIMEKISKGQTLSEAEQFVLKSVVKAGFFDKKDKDDDKDDDKAEKAVSPTPSAPPMAKGKDEDDKEMDKSLAGIAASHDEVSKGLEMSPFLAGWTEVQSEALVSSEHRIVKAINALNKSLARMDTENSSFQSELAKSVAALAEVLTLQGQRLDQIESTPARGPKSIQTPQVFEKSFGHGGNSEPELTKSQILDTMVDMVEKGKLNAKEVIRFESSNELPKELYPVVVAYRAGR